jgi:hypothetical protein
MIDKLSKSFPIIVLCRLLLLPLTISRCFLELQ